jgi:transketolase
LHSKDTIQSLIEKADSVRLKMLEMLKISNTPGAHYGGSLSVLDILVTLYFHVLNIDPADPGWEERDRCILSKGHACAALCTVLAEKGYFLLKELNNFNQLNSPFGVHPDMHKIPGCDISAGSLGHGLPIGVGMALAAKLRKKSYRTYVVLSDGELAEGSCWEAMMSAAHYNLGNLCGIIDRNRLSLDGPTGEIMELEPLKEKILSFGWHVLECNGHDIGMLINAFNTAIEERSGPTMILANTVKGRGISFMEGEYKWHYGKLSDEQYDKAYTELTI